MSPGADGSVENKEPRNRLDAGRRLWLGWPAIVRGCSHCILSLLHYCFCAAPIVCRQVGSVLRYKTACPKIATPCTAYCISSLMVTNISDYTDMKQTLHDKMGFGGVGVGINGAS